MILSLPFHERWMTSQLCFSWNYQNEQWWCDWFELPRLELTYPNETIKVLPDIVIVFGKQHEFLKARMTHRTGRRTHHVASESIPPESSDGADVNPQRLEAPEGLRDWRVESDLSKHGFQLAKSMECLQWGIPWILEMQQACLPNLYTACCRQTPFPAIGLWLGALCIDEVWLVG